MSRTAHVSAHGVREPSQMPRDPLYRRLVDATSPLDVVTSSRMRDHGISRHVMSRRVADGAYVRVGKGVYVPIRSAQREVVQLAAALERGGPESFVGSTTAAWLHRAWDRKPRGLHVSSPRNVLAGRASPVTFHRISPDDVVETVVVDGLRVADGRRTFRDAARVLTEHQLTALLRGLEFRQLVDPDDLRAWYAAGARGPGSRTARVALELHARGCRGTKSASEDLLLERLGSWGWPVPIVNTRGAAGEAMIEADFVFPAWLLVVEVDGPFHDTDEQRRIDGERDALLEAAGWRVVRVRASDVWRRPDAVRRRLERARRASIPTL